MTNNDIGFVLLKLTNSSAHDKILDTIKQLSLDRPFDQTVIFNSFCDKIDTKNLPILHLSHAKFFYGKLFVFDLAGVMISQKFTNVSKRYLYANDIPWMNSPSNKYVDWINIYMPQNLDIVVSNNRLSDVYELAWKKPIGVLEDFNYDSIKKIV